MNNYKELIELLRKYKQTKIWKQIDGDDIFKITGHKKPIYISILGKKGECTDLNIFYGKEELFIQYDMIYGEYVNYPDNPYRLTCFKLIIDDVKEVLSKENAKILKENHIKTDVCVLRFEEGKRPRIVTEEEASMLIKVMKDLLTIIEYMKNTAFKFSEEFILEEKYAFTVKDDKVTYKKEKFPLGHEIKAKSLALNEDILNKLLLFNQKGTFGLGMFEGPFYIEEAQEYNKLLILSDLETGMILDIKVFPRNEEANVCNFLLEAFLKIKKYPKNIAVASTKTLLLIKEVISELKINYRVDTDMNLLFEQYQGALNFVQNQR